jgi:hypothetical protein
VKSRCLVSREPRRASYGSGLYDNRMDWLLRERTIARFQHRATTQHYTKGE